jgi:hypothetical protein
MIVESIPLSPMDNHAESIHGVPWPHIFRIRNGVAFKWYRRFRM